MRQFNNDIVVNFVFSDNSLSEICNNDYCFSFRREVTDYLLESQHLFYLMYEAQDLEIHTQHSITIPSELPDLPIMLGTTWVSFNLVLQKPCRNRVSGIKER